MTTFRPAVQQGLLLKQPIRVRQRTRPVDVSPVVHMTRGLVDAPVLVVCDPPSDYVWKAMLPMAQEAMNYMLNAALDVGFKQSELTFVRLCPPIKQEDIKSDSRSKAHVGQHTESLLAYVQKFNPKVVVALGNFAASALSGRSVKITKARGGIIEREGLPPIFPMFSPGFVLRVPEHGAVFKADLATLKKLLDNNLNASALRQETRDYQWRYDISDLLGANKPSVVAVDTETIGGVHHWKPEQAPITVQLCPRPGQVFCIPVHPGYWRNVFPDLSISQMHRVVTQLKELLEDPSVRKIGFMLKYDHHVLRNVGINVRGWLYDAVQMVFQCDENLISYSLDETVRIFVPEMAGYNDANNREINKDDMMSVEPDRMLSYGGGDPDATIQLARACRERLQRDRHQMNLLRRVQMPALMLFAQVTEKYGMLVDDHALEELGNELSRYLEEMYNSLIRRVPAPVRRKYLEAKKDLNFKSPSFMIDTLFSKDGFGLEPVVFTESTRDLEDKTKRVPSTSAKDHLPHFVTDPKAGNFVVDLIDYLKARTLKSNFVGDRQEGNGLWQYINPLGEIHPNFWLHRTDTGRTASSDPNGQNFPKRGRWAKSYAKALKARPGYKLAASDLSQIELRLIAWSAMEPTMLEVYRSGGDIHETTAAFVLGVPEEVFRSWKRDDRLLVECANEIPGSGEFLRSLNPGARREAKVRDFYKLQRFRAKAVNFGKVYGMGWRNFMQYAKVEYGVDFTERESKEIHEKFFKRYRLQDWHKHYRRMVRMDGYVRALHGAIRRLPSIYSNDEAIRSQAERQAINSPIQRFGSDLGVIAAVRFQAQVDPDVARVVLFVHDQVVLEVREGCEEEMVQALCWAMQNPPLREWFGLEAPIPFGSDAEIGDNLAELEERPNLTARKPSWWKNNEDEVIRDFCLGLGDRHFHNPMRMAD